MSTIIKNICCNGIFVSFMVLIFIDMLADFKYLRMYPMYMKSYLGNTAGHYIGLLLWVIGNIEYA